MLIEQFIGEERIFEKGRWRTSQECRQSTNAKLKEIICKRPIFAS
jgi:hypothetical protein